MSEIVRTVLAVGDLIAHFDAGIHPNDFMFDPDVGLVLLVDSKSATISWSSMEDMNNRIVTKTPLSDVVHFLNNGSWYFLSRESSATLIEPLNKMDDINV